MLKQLFRQSQNLIVACILLATVGIFAELGLRNSQQWTSSNDYLEPVSHLLQASDHCYHQLKPQSRHTHEHVVYEINRIGLRGALPTPEASKRILILGGSSIFGIGLQESETIPARLQQFLQTNGHEIEVVNGGVPRNSPLLSAILYRQRLARLHPDRIIVCIDQEGLESEYRHRQLTINEGDLLLCPNPKITNEKQSSSLLTLSRKSAIVNWAIQSVIPPSKPRLTHLNSANTLTSLTDFCNQIAEPNDKILVCVSLGLSENMQKNVQQACESLGLRCFRFQTKSDETNPQSLWPSGQPPSRLGAALYARDLMKEITSPEPVVFDSL